MNQYKSWVDMYKTDEFWQGSAWLIEHIEKLAAEVSEERKQELVDIFVTGVENEYMFWSSAYDMQYTWKPNGIRRADSPARSLPIVYFHMKRRLPIGFGGRAASYNVRIAIRARDECAPRRHAGNDGRARNGCR